MDKITKEISTKIRVFRDLFGFGINKDDFCRYLGFTRQTVSREIKKESTIQKHLKKIERVDLHKMARWKLKELKKRVDSA